MNGESNIFLFISAGIVFSQLYYRDFVSPFHQAFKCSDISIAKPFKNGTISTSLLVIISCTVPSAAFILFEYSFTLTTSKTGFQQLETVIKYLINTWIVIVEYFVGFTNTLNILNLLKTFFGHLRPHFFDVCKPNFAKIDCSQELIAEPHCTSGNAYRIRDSRESFPSGHAMVSVYSAFFLLFYFRKRKSLVNKLSVQIFMFFFILWVGSCCVTRIIDHWHHEKDIIGGMIGGFFIALLTFKRPDGPLV